MKKHIIYAIVAFVVIFGIIILANYWIFQNVSTVTGESAQDLKLKTLEDVLNEREIIRQENEVKDFVKGYFKTIQKGDFVSIRKNYLDNKALMTIVAGCGSQEDQTKGIKILGDTKRIKELWKKCSYFTGVRVEILKVNKIDTKNYEVVAQFFDKDGSVIRGGFEENKGRIVNVFRDLEGNFRVKNWYFAGVSDK